MTKEPTPAMIAAGMNTIMRLEKEHLTDNRPWLASEIWRAMEQERQRELTPRAPKNRIAEPHSAQIG